MLKELSQPYLKLFAGRRLLNGGCLNSSLLIGPSFFKPIKLFDFICGTFRLFAPDCSVANAPARRQPLANSFKSTYSLTVWTSFCPADINQGSFRQRNHEQCTRPSRPRQQRPQCLFP